MTQKPMPINESDYDEKKRPFDDVIRQILKAKPTHRNTDKPKGRLKKKKKAENNGSQYQNYVVLSI